MKTLNQATRDAALHRQGQLTKPPGALGRLEAVAVRLAAMQGRVCPRIERPWISVFAADHGVVAEGVSAFPQAVTGQMILNFMHGGAAICVLARETGAALEVVDVGSLLAADVMTDIGNDAGRAHRIIDRSATGTANFAREAAMSASALEHAWGSGRRAVERARAAGADLFVGGEMGIGNTTTSVALACALLDADPAALAGPGTGLDAAGVRHKAQVIGRALALHGPALADPREALRRVGGFEIAALAGAFAACAEYGLPAVIDGLIASTAALVAERLHPGARDWWLFGHRSAEPAHTQVLAALDAEPLLDLGMRLGEGSGAAAALPLIRLACALHADMATFEEAAVASQ
ncbi:MAG: nicotinate-nucleotide--dimethylbenzimidazole phosphoribosyltransferase [Pseudomonadota bacterium]